MKRLTWFLATAMLVAVAIPALAGHKGEKCTYDAQTCLNHFSAYKDKGWMGIEYDKSEDGVVSVKKVLKDAPAQKAGFMTGDVLVTRNGIKMADYEAQKADQASWKPGARVTYTVLRKNVERNLTVTLAPMPEEIYARMVGEHMISDHMAAATTAATTEEEKAAATSADKK